MKIAEKNLSNYLLQFFKIFFQRARRGLQLTAMAGPFAAPQRRLARAHLYPGISPCSGESSPDKVQRAGATVLSRDDVPGMDSRQAVGKEAGSQGCCGPVTHFSRIFAQKVIAKPRWKYARGLTG